MAFWTGLWQVLGSMVEWVNLAGATCTSRTKLAGCVHRVSCPLRLDQSPPVEAAGTGAVRYVPLDEACANL